MTVNRLNHTGYYLTDLAAVIFILSKTLSLADSLLNNLPGGLGCHTAKIIRCAYHHFQVAVLCIFIYLSGFSNEDLSPIVHDIINDFLFNKNGHFPGFEINFGLNLLSTGSVYRPPVGRNHGVL